MIRVAGLVFGAGLGFAGALLAAGLAMLVLVFCWAALMGWARGRSE